MPEGESPQLKKSPEQLRELAQPVWREQASQSRESLQLIQRQDDPTILSKINERMLTTINECFSQKPGVTVRKNIDPASLRQTLVDTLTKFVPENVPNNVHLRNSRSGPILIRKPYSYGLSLLPLEINVALYHYGFVDGEHKTITAVAKQFGITKQRVSQIDSDVKEKLSLNPQIRRLALQEENSTPEETPFSL